MFLVVGSCVLVGCNCLLSFDMICRLLVLACWGSSVVCCLLFVGRLLVFVFCLLLFVVGRCVV